MANINVNYTDRRITKLRLYMFEILDNLLTDTNYQVNANFLSNDINNYSLDKIPTSKEPTGNWIIPTKEYRDVYEFRSRNAYGQDEITNLTNIGFFEALEDKIYSNNEQGVLPDIDGIESIECLNCGALNIADTNTAEFSIQIQITYLKIITKTSTSL